MKSCSDCKYFRSVGDEFEDEFECAHESSQVRMRPSLVTGTAHIASYTCQYMRSKKGACGDAAVLFEPVTLGRKIIRWIAAPY